MISLHRSWALSLAGPTDDIIRQRFSGLDMGMNIVFVFVSKGLKLDDTSDPYLHPV